MAAAPPTLRLQATPVASQYGGFRLSPPSPPLVIRARSSVPLPLHRTRLLNLNLNQSLSASPPRRRRSGTSATSSDFIHPVGKVMGPNLLLVNSSKRGDTSDGQWYFFSRTGKSFPSEPSGEVLVIGLLNKKETKGTVLFLDPKFQEWDSISSKFAAAANVPFLLLQLPQIVLNARNLLAGNTAALFAVPWLGMLTGLLGNLSLLSYFAKKKETEAVFVQTLGVVSTYAVIAQLSIAKAMPLPQFVATTIVVAVGLVLNFLNYFGRLPKAIWNHWEDFITIGGLAVLPQVMWSTFVPFVPNSILPGLISLTLAVTTVAMARSGRLSEKGTRLVGSVSGWTATLLFMWMPVAQMWTNYLNPDNIKGLSAFTMLLAMMGNGLMIPRALFIRDLMWFTGSAWATFLQGWGNLFCMYCFNTISRVFFFGTSIGLLLWIGMVLWRDTVAYGHRSPLTSLKELFFGS